MTATARILIVDDDHSVRASLKLALEKKDWLVDVVESAEEALAKHGENPYDLLIVDKNLPGMSGVQLVGKVKDKDNDVAALMITGYPSVENALEMLNLGIDGYIEKPFDDIFIMVKKVHSALAKGRQKDTKPLMTIENHPLGGRDLQILAASPHSSELEWIASQLDRSRDEVQCLASSRETLAQINRQAPDVLIADASLYDPDVFQLISDATAAAPEIACLVISEKPTLGVITNLIEIGVRGLVEKPLESSKFGRIFESIVWKTRFHAKDAADNAKAQT